MKEYLTNCVLVYLLPVWQIFLNLCGDTNNTNPASLSGEAGDDEFAHEVHEMDSKVALVTASRCQVILGFVYEDWQAVKIHLPIVQNNEKALAGYFSSGFTLPWHAACHYEIYYADGIKSAQKGWPPRPSSS